MRVSLLGPLRVENEHGEVTIAAAKERCLLAALSLSPGAVVSTESLLVALWGELPPASARKTLQTYVSNLRRALGPRSIETAPAGYALRVAAADVDVARFRELARRGEDALRRGLVPEAQRLLAEAQSLWRGDPFADVARHAGLAGEAARLGEEYWSAVEVRYAAELAAGRHALVTGELESLTRQHPLRERLWAHLMLALYRCGRQADALDAFQRVRSLLLDELGLEPGGELQRMQAAILGHDPSLDAVLADAAGRTRGATGTVADPVRRSAVRYAVCDDGVHVAYQVVSDGPVDIIVVPGFVSHLDIWWDAPTDRLLRRLASMSRLIVFDKRGMGLSDRPEQVDLEHWVEDIRAVLDAVGSEQALVLGISAGSPTAAQFAATHPDRTRALALYGGYARALHDDDYSVGATRDYLDEWTARLRDGWGTGVGLSVLAPSLRADSSAREFWARYQRLSASPGAAASFLRALWEIDVRDLLPLIDVPTLVLHASRDLAARVEAARYMADRIRGSTFIELDSDIHLIWLSDQIDTITTALEQFIAEAVPSTDVERVLATVLVVRPALRRGGWRRWFEEVVERHRGTVLGQPGTAGFDGPARAIRCAEALTRGAAERGEPLGAGIHVGECQRVDGDLRGAAVGVAARVADLAGPEDVLVSRTVRDLVTATALEFTARGRVAVRDGEPAWDVFDVRGADRPAAG